MPFFKALRMPSRHQHQQQQQQHQQRSNGTAQHQQQQQQQQQQTRNYWVDDAGDVQAPGRPEPPSAAALMQYQYQKPQPQQPTRPQQLAFYCQLAHGSPTGLISGFGNLRELYFKIGECFNMRPEDVLFCTLNTHKIEMSELVGGQIGLEDFIYAHKKGRPKEIELVKTEDALGLTLTDNGCGYVFIKRIMHNSIMDRLGVVQVGDHLEKLNGQSLVGKRHIQVSRMLKDIPRGSTLVLRLVEPMTRTGFGVIGPRVSGPRSRGKIVSYGSGKETLRFKADGYARIEQVNEDNKTIEKIERINNALEIYMGISDYVLARRLWEIAQNKINSMDLAKAIDSTMPDMFDFPENFIFEVWRIAFQARKH